MSSDKMDLNPSSDLSAMMDGAGSPALRERRNVKVPEKFGNFATKRQLQSAFDNDVDNSDTGDKFHKAPAGKATKSSLSKAGNVTGSKRTSSQLGDSRASGVDTKKRARPSGKRVKTTHDSPSLAAPSASPAVPSAEQGLARVSSKASVSSNNKSDVKLKKRSSAGETRLAPFGKPLVWAEGRQALCESNDWYRAYQSAAYTHNLRCFGFMLGKDNSDRNYLDEEVAITRAGGHCGKDENGDMVQIKSHSMGGGSVKAFINNMENHFPIVCILGKGNLQCAIEPPHEYSVMDNFHVTDIWYEKNNGCSCIKYRLEKINLDVKSWWAPVGTPLPPSNEERNWSVRATKQECAACHKTSKQILKTEWVCLNAECSAFWKLSSGEEPSVSTSYDLRFLSERTAYAGPAPVVIRPDTATILRNIDNTVPYTRESWHGIICPQCGRCNSRSDWAFWKCDTDGCDFTRLVQQPILSPADCRGDSEIETEELGIAEDTVNASHDIIRSHSYPSGNWNIYKYGLTEGNTIHHLVANKWINQEAGGPDDIFRALQDRNGCGIVRGEMVQHTGAGKVLAKHFSRNFGMPYKYVVKVDSESFGSAPAPIIEALSRMTWAGRKTAADNGSLEFKNFNELLAVGYFTDLKMGFHDDGEKELGPTIATLSLGGAAKMQFRMKERYYLGHTKSGRYNHLEPVLPGAYLEEERKDLNATYDQTKPADFAQSVEEMYNKALKAGNKPPGKPPVLMTMILRHGDMIVMNGWEMQKYYEHTVIPTGQMRFGLTCRYIKPDLVAASEHWKAQYDASSLNIYSGFETQGPSRGLAPPLPSQQMTAPDTSSASIDSANDAMNTVSAIDNATIMDVTTVPTSMENVEADDANGATAPATTDATPGSLNLGQAATVQTSTGLESPGDTTMATKQE